METNKTLFARRTVIMVLIIFGWVLCGYLVFRIKQLNGSNIKIPDLCNLIFSKSCDPILSNRFSQLFGFSFAGIGLAYFGLLGLLFSLRKLVIDRLVMFITALGTGAGAFLSYIIIKGGLTCTLCMMIHLLNPLILIFLLIGLRNSVPSLLTKSNSGRSFYLRWSVMLLMVIAIGGFSQYLLLRASFNKLSEVNLDVVTKEFEKEKVYQIPVNDLSPHLGSTTSPVQLVVFSSFQCPACKTFGPILETISKKYGNKIGITFKNFPLSSVCNPRLEGNLQPQSCDAAFAAIAAQLQDRFWEYHDLLFQSDMNFDENLFRSIAEKTELNMEKWENDRHADTVKKVLIEDLKIAYRIGINATPSVFVNGRRINNPQESVLNFLIENELKKK
jgi:protein-disulfide isomerase/uncharacterized membrane protein